MSDSNFKAEEAAEVANQPRRYNEWAGNPKGIAENTMNCIESVQRNWLYYQCSRKRGHGEAGEYCKQHAKWHPAGG